MEQFVSAYEEACAASGPWNVAHKTLAREFRPAKIAQLCQSTSGAGGDGLISTASTEADKRSRATFARQPLHRLNPPTSTSSSSSSSTKRRVLVPLSGGVASLACAWWALQRPEFDVYFCYLVGLDRACVERELVAVLQLLRYGRDNAGKPLSDCNDPNDIVGSPTTRIKVLPMPTQPYTLETDAANKKTKTKKKSAAAEVDVDMKHHPLTYALLYRQILNAAQAFECTDIVWGLFERPRKLIEALHSLFNESIVSHQNWFPFDRRSEAFEAFVAAAQRSDSVWKDKEAPITTSDAGATRSAVQTASASLMPDAAHFAWTCGLTELPNATHDATQRSVVAKKGVRKKKTSTTSKSNGNEKEEEEEAETTEAFVARRVSTVGMLNWCGQCVDCAPWKSVTAKFVRSQHEQASSTTVSTALQTHNLLDAYTTIVASGLETDNRKQTSKRRGRTNTLPVRKRRRMSKKDVATNEENDEDEEEGDDDDVSIDDEFARDDDDEDDDDDDSSDGASFEEENDDSDDEQHEDDESESQVDDEDVDEESIEFDNGEMDNDDQDDDSDFEM